MPSGSEKRGTFWPEVNFLFNFSMEVFLNCQRTANQLWLQEYSWWDGFGWKVARDMSPINWLYSGGFSGRRQWAVGSGRLSSTMCNKVGWAKLHYHPTLNKASQQAAEGGIQDAAGGVHILEWHPQACVYSHQVLYSFHPQTAIVGDLLPFLLLLHQALQLVGKEDEGDVPAGAAAKWANVHFFIIFFFFYRIIPLKYQLSFFVLRPPKLPGRPSARGP
jgi:hypothetical protein